LMRPSSSIAMRWAMRTPIRDHVKTTTLVAPIRLLSLTMSSAMFTEGNRVKFAREFVTQN